jgi:hypothetical protein
MVPNWHHRLKRLDPVERKSTNIRLSINTRDKLKHVAGILNKSQSDITEQALKDWFEKHNFTETYQVTLTETSVVLLETGDSPRILEVTERNGISPQEVAQNYKQKLQAPVRLVIQEKDPWPKKQS